MDQSRWDVRESRSVRTPWVWRGLLMMSLVAIGVALIMSGNHQHTLAIMWGVIAVGWFSISMWLWRMHRRLEG